DIEAVAQFPDGIALNEQPIGDDERRGLNWRQGIEPDGGGNQAEGKPANSGDQGCGKRAEQEQGELERDNVVHVASVRSSRIGYVRADHPRPEAASRNQPWVSSVASRHQR